MARRVPPSLSRRRFALAALAALSLAAACGGGDGSPANGEPGPGGVADTGGVAGGASSSLRNPGTGGAAALGGRGDNAPAGVGGQPGSGAVAATDSGGASGAQSTGGSGGGASGGRAGGTEAGASETGGSASAAGSETGGATSSGGTEAGGTTSSGGSQTGGATSSGGAGTGGAAGSAGSGAGGTAGFGGSGTGGTVGTGGRGLVTGCDGETSGLAASAIFYVSPTGSASGDGLSFASAMDFSTALAAVDPGEMILLEPGTYAIPYTEGVGNTIQLSKSSESGAPITIVAADCGRAVFDFSFPEQAWVQDSYGFYVTGSYWYLKGIDVTRAGYQGTYVTGQHNTLENCAFYDNRNTGLEINEGGAYTTVLNCDAYRNYDPKKYGGMADGFAPKQTQGPGNVLVGCRAWENSDDGFDTYDSPEVVVIERSWAFRNGVDVWGYGGFDGNGNGFKLGGNRQVAHNRITGSVAFGNVVKGFDQNNNAGGLTILNCTGYANGTNFGLGNPVNDGELHLLRNNVSLGASDSIANADAEYNSWNSGFSVSAADFESLDVAQATVARNPDGSLPQTALFRLTAASSLVDAGVDVGLSFTGSAPDLGAFERGQ
jgi:hypothetical protein